MAEGAPTSESARAEIVTQAAKKAISQPKIPYLGTPIPDLGLLAPPPQSPPGPREDTGGEPTVIVAPKTGQGVLGGLAERLLGKREPQPQVLVEPGPHPPTTPEPPPAKQPVISPEASTEQLPPSPPHPAPPERVVPTTQRPEDTNPQEQRIRSFYSSEFDHTRQDTYTRRQDGDYEILTDPATGRDVAREPATNSTSAVREGFDPHRTDYVRQESGGFVTTIDPRTGNEVVRLSQDDVAEYDRRTRYNPPSPTPAEASGGSGGSGGHEDEPPPPVDENNLEYEASPERGRQIAEEIVELEGLRAAGRIQEENWTRLKELYLQQRVHMEAVKLVGLRVVVYEPDNSLTEVRPRTETLRTEPSRLVDIDGDPLSSVQDLIEGYRTGRVTNPDKFAKQVEAYFAEAHRIGLFKELDRALEDIYKKEVLAGIQKNLTGREIMSGGARSRTQGVNQMLQEAVSFTVESYMDRTLTDLEIGRLEGVWDLYVQLARGRFVTAIDRRDLEGLNQRPYIIDHEFRLGQETEGEDEPEETYWKTTQGWYVEITAQNEEQFKIAADSYINRLEAITAAPQKLFQEVEQFITILYKSEGAKKMSSEFLNKLVMGIEARLGVFGADHSNELYHADYYKQYLDYINKDGKGPARWLELTKSMDGQVAAALWMLDKDPRWEILFSLFGSRGQLAGSSQAQRAEDGAGLYDQVKELLVDELMGVRISNTKNVSNASLPSNITRFTSDKKFTSFYDGLFRYGKAPQDRFSGDANIRVYNALKDVPDEQLTTDQRRVKRLGRIQLDLLPVSRGGRGKRVEHLSHKDHKIYEKEREKAEKAFEIAMEIYGALGEKSKRAGGVFKTKEQIDTEGKKFQYFVPVHQAEKFVQFAETMTKMQYADASAKVRTAKVKEARDRAIAAIKEKGFEAKLYDGSIISVSDGTNMLSYDTANLFNSNDKNKRQALNIIFDSDGRPTNLNFDNHENANVYDVQGNRIVINSKTSRAEALMLKTPEVDPNDEDKYLEGADGRVKVKLVPVDFYIATHHSYGDWTSHTYWSYQEEDRHNILSPTTFANARLIRDGKMRPEDLKDPWAIQLLIIDPTLKRVRRFTEKNFEERERKLTMAAVEDSYQSHWRLSRELYRAFSPKYETPSEEGHSKTEDIQIYYGLQDYGGFRKMIEHARARAAEDPERFARRGRRLIPDIHIPAAALSEIWGQGSSGSLGVLRMLGAPVYKMGGTFALDKFAAQSDIANKLYSALFNTQDEHGVITEGLLLKPTNEADTTLVEFRALFANKKIGEEYIWPDPHEQQKFCVALRKSFGRLEKYEKLLVTMETLIRNASGAAWLENIDVLKDNVQLDLILAAKQIFARLPDVSKKDATTADLNRFIRDTDAINESTEGPFNGNFNIGNKDNPGIDMGSTSADTGSGRHSAWQFHQTFMALMVDASLHGGAEIYPGERDFYAHLFDNMIVNDVTRTNNVRKTLDTISKWLFGKFVPT